MAKMCPLNGCKIKTGRRGHANMMIGMGLMFALFALFATLYWGRHVV